MNKFIFIFLLSFLPIAFLSLNYYQTTIWDKNNKFQYSNETIAFICDNKEDLNPYVYHFHKGTLKEKEAFELSKIFYDSFGNMHSEAILNRVIYNSDFKISWREVKADLPNDYFDLNRKTLRIKLWRFPEDDIYLDCNLSDSVDAFTFLNNISEERIEAYQKKLDERQF